MHNFIWLQRRLGARGAVVIGMLAVVSLLGIVGGLLLLFG